MFWIKLFLSGLIWAFRKAFRESFLLPRPSALRTADECMKIVHELTCEHGGSGTAFPYAKRALELDPRHSGANGFMAYYYVSSGKFSQALPYAERRAQCHPDSLSARNVLATVQEGLERHPN